MTRQVEQHSRIHPLLLVPSSSHTISPSALICCSLTDNQVANLQQYHLHHLWHPLIHDTTESISSTHFLILGVTLPSLPFDIGITCLVHPEKIDEPNRTRLVAGGDRVHYPGDAGTPTANLLTVKLLINSIISTPGAKFMTMDIKDFYLNTPMTRYEYMWLKISDMPDDVIEHYNLQEIATPDGFIYCDTWL